MSVKSHLLGPGTLSLGEEGSPAQFAASLTKCSLTPSVDTTDPIAVLSGDELEGDDTFTWAISGTMLQSYEVESLTDWCFDHRGELVPFTFAPVNTAAMRSWTGSLRVRPVQVGGDVKKRNTSDFEFPLKGEPAKAVTDGESDPQ